MAYKVKETVSLYPKSQMIKDMCSICGENPGRHTFKGKAVCSTCVEYIRKRH